MIKNEIKKIIYQTILSLQKRGDLSNFKIDKISVERPENNEYGDFSTNIPFKISSFIKKNPFEIATVIANEINKTLDFKKVEAIKPGFINFYIKKEILHKELQNIISKKEKYAVLGKKGKINLEFISANPTGELHLGHGRGAFYGDVLANVLVKVGYKVDREFFINNAKNSNQIKELGKTVLGRGESYKTDYLKKKIKDLRFRIRDLKKKKPKELWESEAGYLMANGILRDVKIIIGKKLKINFDKWFSEQNLFENSKVEKIYKTLKNKNFIYEKDGAVWIKTSQYGDDEDRVIVRSTGEPTYFLSDIAYHSDKFNKKYDKLIDIWGADHQGHVKRMMAVKKMMGWKKDFNILISQMVGLKTSGKYLKLSKRKGQIVTLDWLINEVGLDVARFFYLVKSLNTQMEFDLDLAKEQSEKNPVFYVQYAYARISSIFRKAKNFKIRRLKLENFQLLNHQSELNLIKKLSQWPEIIEDSSNDYEIHRITTYALELAKFFSQFYRDCKIILDDKNLSNERLLLTLATQIILKDILNILGIKAPSKM